MTANVSLLGLGNTVSTQGLSHSLPLNYLPFGESPSKRSTSVYTGDDRKVWLTNNNGGWTLIIAPDGTVRSSRDVNPALGILYLQTVAFLAMVTPAPLTGQTGNASTILFSIQGEKSGYYLCMNATGVLYSKTGNEYHRNHRECVFAEQFLITKEWVWFSALYPKKKKRHQFLPNKKRKWYIAIDKHGRIVNGKKTRERQKRTRFHLRPMIDDNKDIFESLVPSAPPLAVTPRPHNKLHGRKKPGRRRQGSKRRRRINNKKGPDGPFITYGSSHNRRSRRKTRRSRTRQTESRRQQSSPFGSNL